MILDTTANLAHYLDLNPLFAVALDFVRKPETGLLAPGRYEVQGQDVCAIVDEYQTKVRAQGRWEAHRRYVDIQCVLEGQELMGYSNLSAMRTATPYDPERDVEFFDGEGQFFVVPAGSFAMFAPQDAHMPSLCVSTPEKVRKLVLKVRGGR
jgi:biofilm protein TabA